MKIGDLYITAIVKKDLSEEQIEKIRNSIETEWLTYSYQYNLSEDFIREFQNKVIWTYISSEQVLSESFLREFKDKIDWYWVCLSQKLSKEFIIEFIDRINFYDILDNDNISQDIKDYCRMFI